MSLGDKAGPLAKSTVRQYTEQNFRDALRSEFIEDFLRESRLRIEPGAGVFMDTDKLRAIYASIEAGQPRIEEAEWHFVDADSAGNLIPRRAKRTGDFAALAKEQGTSRDADDAVLRFPFSRAEWLIFAVRNDVRDCWTIDKVDGGGQFVGHEADLDAISQLERLSLRAAELVKAVVLPAGVVLGQTRHLSIAQEEDVRRALAAGQAISAVAKSFGVDRKTIGKYKPGGERAGSPTGGKTRRARNPANDPFNKAKRPRPGQ